MNYKNIFLEG